VGLSPIAAVSWERGCALLHVWTVDELIALLSAAEATPIKRGTYRKTRERKAELRGGISD
jgi:hypothetical protein